MPISLKPHNVETYQKVTDKLKTSNKVAVIHPTGTGKMYIALKLLEENKGKKAIYVAPSNPILHDVKKNIFAEGMTMSEFPELKRITYQKLARLTDEEIQELGSDIIILDEFHHCGASKWGKGVERLLQRNEGASVLGLSATPLRYTDGLRDMADELFENNVASEMTLEEAIESEILPEASYVSTLYGYDKELEDMQTNIDKIKDEDKRKEAQDLLNSLRDKLDENTQNLPELFSEHMQNKSGKYIIFCRNIDDMNEKMEQAQKMFGGVNSNITIRGVSSKIKKSDKILTEFEQDSENGTLKLLYAVDMLNEGYHIKDLDGVVMMRPTFSPTIYTQQLGRALTVGGDKRPVVLDLVNNFDSCKIIEDFAERMKQYKGNDGTGRTGRTEKNKKSRLSIFDKTKEFREIAEKITELSKKSKVKLEQKIEIFEKFMQTGEELVGNTTFQGYPIGQWAIQIRNAINRMNDGKVDKITVNPTEEQLERLENMGILERQIDSTIDEKIDSLVEWRRKYPKIKITTIATDEELREYAKTDEEFSQIREEYEKMQRYYDYVRYRKYQGKLNEEQISRGKEGNVGEVFGFPVRVEELAKKYGIAEKDADYIWTKYGTLDNFYEAYKEEKFDSRKDANIAMKVIRDIVDIDGNPNRNYERIFRALHLKGERSKELIIFSSEKLKEMIEQLTEKEKYVLKRRFGLVDDALPKDLETVGSEINATRERVRQIETKALRKLGFPERRKATLIDFSFDYENMTDEEIKQVDIIKRDIQLQNGDLSENLEKFKTVQEEIKARRKEEERATIEKKKEELKQRIIGSEQPPIEELVSFSYDDLIEIGIESELATKISSEIEEYKTRKEEKERVDIENVDFSVRTFNCLKRAGINSLEDLSNMTEEQLMKVRKLRKKSVDEVIAKMNEYGITLKKDEKQEQTKQEDCVATKAEKNDRPKTELEIELEKKYRELFGKDEEQQEETEKVDEDIVETKKPVTDNNEQKKGKIRFENMTPEQLQEMIERNQRIIESNERQIKEDTEKSKLIKRLLEQQQTIEAQQEEMKRLREVLGTQEQ